MMTPGERAVEFRFTLGALASETSIYLAVRNRYPHHRADIIASLSESAG